MEAPQATPNRRPRRSDFEIESLLGEGSLCRVYLVRNIHSKRPVAMKIIRKQRVQNASAMQMILAERKILASLEHHPNIVKLLCSFQDDACLYFILDYVSGGTLADVLLRYNHRINPALTVYWVCDIVNILCYLRSQQIAHRDIKVSTCGLPFLCLDTDLFIFVLDVLYSAISAMLCCRCAFLLYVPCLNRRSVFCVLRPLFCMLRKKTSKSSSINFACLLQSPQ